MKNLLKQMNKQELLSEKNKQVMNTKISSENREKRIQVIENILKECK